VACPGNRQSKAEYSASLRVQHRRRDKTGSKNPGESEMPKDFEGDGGGGKEFGRTRRGENKC
jgi:hypothetical protein